LNVSSSWLDNSPHFKHQPRSGLIKHIESDRLRQFAIEAINFTEAENTHLDDCDTCGKQLVVAIQFAGREKPSQRGMPLII
jgi:hypothetical protein